MAQNQNKQWNGMTSVRRVVLVLVLLFVAFSLTVQSMISNAQGNAFRASCQSNMKQLGLAMEQYSQDSDSSLPPLVDRSGTKTWRETLYLYVKSPGVYRCPDDQHNPQNSPNKLPDSYDANALCWGSGKKKANIFSLSSATILVTDTRGFDGEDWDITSPAFLPSSGRRLYTHKPSHYFYQHPDGWLNCLFADGHVKAMKPDATLTPINLWTPNAAPFAGQDSANAQAILKHAENE